MNFTSRNPSFYSDDERRRRKSPLPLFSEIKRHTSSIFIKYLYVHTHNSFSSCSWIVRNFFLNMEHKIWVEWISHITFYVLSAKLLFTIHIKRQYFIRHHLHTNIHHTLCAHHRCSYLSICACFYFYFLLQNFFYFILFFILFFLFVVRARDSDLVWKFIAFVLIFIGNRDAITVMDLKSLNKFHKDVKQ